MLIAEYEGEQKTVFEVPFQTDSYCLDCGDRVRVWREAEDGTARHFKHVENMGEGGGGGSSDCAGPAESDEHYTWKLFARSRLNRIFEDAAEVTDEKTLYAPHTDKDRREADAAVMFDERDEQLGSGLAVEVQHKNKSKDVESTTLDYIKQDIAVAWLYADDFSDDGCRLAEIDFRQRAGEAVSISDLGNPVPWWLHLDRHVEPLLKRIQNSPTSFNRDDCEHELEAWTTEVRATFPEPIVDTLRYRESDWSALFTGQPTDHFRAQAAVPRSATSLRVESRITEAHFWNGMPWKHRFNAPATDAYIRQVAATGNTELVFGAVLPLEYVSKQKSGAVDSAPKPPNTPHDDVQCHRCGKYRYAPSAPQVCQNCGTPYDWSWNVETGRIASDSVPTPDERP
jgi:ribosomal protein L37E